MAWKISYLKELGKLQAQLKRKFTMPHQNKYVLHFQEFLLQKVQSNQQNLGAWSAFPTRLLQGPRYDFRTVGADFKKYFQKLRIKERFFMKIKGKKIKFSQNPSMQNKFS